MPYGSVSHKAADDYVNKSLTAIGDAFARSACGKREKQGKFLMVRDGFVQDYLTYTCRNVFLL